MDRSDHFSFAKQGVPAFDPNDGTDFIGKPAGWGQKAHDDYLEKHDHQPSDQFDPAWDFAGLAELALVGEIRALIDLEIKVDRVERDDGGQQRGRARGGAAAGDQVARRDQMGADAPRDRSGDAAVVEVELRVADLGLRCVDRRLGADPAMLQASGGVH